MSWESDQKRAREIRENGGRIQVGRLVLSTEPPPEPTFAERKELAAQKRRETLARKKADAMERLAAMDKEATEACQRWADIVARQPNIETEMP